MSKPHAFIFFGKPGSGKGTQSTLLREYMKEQGDTVMHIETGTRLREFAKGETHLAMMTKKCMDSGDLLPEFIPVWLWCTLLIENWTGTEHLIFDGVARRFIEAELLDTALTFMDTHTPQVVFIDVSNEWAVERLIARKGGRADDTRESILIRLEEYERNTTSSIEYFKNKNNGHFHVINGEQSIEDVQKEIMGKIEILHD